MPTLAVPLVLLASLSAVNAPIGQAVAPSVAPHSAVDPRLPIAAMAPRPSRNRGISVRIPPAATGLPLPHIYGPEGVDRPLVVIDPGHGGHDPGARNPHSGASEKDVTLALALALRDALVAHGRIRVALTREDDSFLALEERYGIARELGASLFISIHADASPEVNAHGATVYTLSDVASDREAARLAARENEANVLNGVDLTGRTSAVSSILIDLSQRETMNASSRFAELLHRETAGATDFRAPWHRSAALVVLRAPDTPSVLFESGYISNDDEAAWLAGEEGRHKIAQGMARAIAIFLATRDAGN